MKTRNALTVVFALLVMTGGTACRKVVDWDLESADPKLVVEGSISNLSKPFEVRLTLSRAYFENEPVPVVETALVLIKDDLGNVDTLSHTGNGLYRTAGDRSCLPGHSYTLEISYEGKRYSCTELCREQLPIDTFTYFYQPFRNGFIQEGYYAFLIAQEIDNPGDYYEWAIYRNDTLVEDFGYIVDSDMFAASSFFNENIDLNNITLDLLPRPFPLTFEEGNRLRLEQRCISKNYYDYLVEFSTQYNQAGSPFDAPPSNPTGNIVGAFGYFSVQNIQVRELLIEKL